MSSACEQKNPQVHLLPKTFRLPLKSSSLPFGKSQWKVLTSFVLHRQITQGLGLTTGTTRAAAAKENRNPSRISCINLRVVPSSPSLFASAQKSKPTIKQVCKPMSPCPIASTKGAAANHELVSQPLLCRSSQKKRSNENALPDSCQHSP